MNVSEFERNKPTKTMAAINTLLKKLKSAPEIKEGAFNILLVDKDVILGGLVEIKKLLKNGE